MSKKEDEDAILATEISARAFEIIKRKGGYTESSRVSGESVEDTMVRIGKQNLVIDLVKSVNRHQQRVFK